jgi:hypothetical protein
MKIFIKNISFTKNYLLLLFFSFLLKNNLTKFFFAVEKHLHENRC